MYNASVIGVQLPGLAIYSVATLKKTPCKGNLEGGEVGRGLDFNWIRVITVHIMYPHVVRSICKQLPLCNNTILKLSGFDYTQHAIMAAVK